MKSQICTTVHSNFFSALEVNIKVNTGCTHFWNTFVFTLGVFTRSVL